MPRGKTLLQISEATEVPVEGQKALSGFAKTAEMGQEGFSSTAPAHKRSVLGTQHSPSHAAACGN